MKPTVERLTEQFTQLIGPEAFAKAEVAIAAAKVAAELAAKAAAEKAAAAAAAAKATAAAAAPKPATAPAGAAPQPAITPVGARPTATAPVPAAHAVAVAGHAEAARPGSTSPATPSTATGPAAASVAARPATPAAAPRPAAPTPAAAPAAVPMPTLPVQTTAHAAKGYHFDATVASTQVVDAARVLDADGFALDTITGVDWIAQNEMEVVYDYFHPVELLRVVVRTRVPRATPELPSITAVFPGANWHERETHDFFGIRFTGHPNLKPFLLPEDANFHPLRKDYQP